MSNPIFLINSYIEKCNSDCNQLCKDLFKQGILTKQYNDDGLILIYNKFDDFNMSQLKRECRSLVLDSTTLKIIAYSCETPNTDTVLESDTSIISESIEGTLLSVFSHKDKWYMSTRRCLDSDKSIFTSDPVTISKSHYQMFEEVLKKTEYNDFNNFSRSLDITKSYYFVLIHYENKHIIDYTEKFGNKYKLLSLVSIKDNNMVEQDIYESNLPFINEYIFLPKKYDSINDFISINNQLKFDTKPQNEGIIIKVFSTEMNKYLLYKLQTDTYKFASIANDGNMLNGMIYLYQQNKLIDYFNQFQNSEYVKMINPLNTNESFFTIGVIDSTFKVCTSELFELFKNLWSLKTGKNQNKELYELLPKEYKDMMYIIRGLYYKKKASLFENTNDKTLEDFKNSHLTISDIYNSLKKLHINMFVNFLKARRLMFNQINSDKTNKNLIEFGKISNFCNKIHLKQCAIFTNKLHPTIN
jgi:hypothetical protein